MTTTPEKTEWRGPGVASKLDTTFTERFPVLVGRLFRHGPHRAVDSLVFRLAVCERQVAVFNHVLDLAFHGEAEEGDEVHDEDGPEHGYIKYFKKGTDKGNHC